MSAHPFVSYAQNGEDVVLWRALQHVHEGRYVDIGANDPESDSVTKAFYDRGWSGLDVEPVADFAALLREQRGRDVVAEVAVSEEDGGEAVLHEFAGTGLSTLRADIVPEQVERGHTVRERRTRTRTLASLVQEHLASQEVHFCKIDVEGAEAAVLRSVDLTHWRPWVLVVEATRPNSAEPSWADWEPGVLAADYRFCLFDGLSRWYVAQEHADGLGAALSYPACPLDAYVPAQLRVREAELAELRQVHHRVTQDLSEAHAQLGRVGELEDEVAGLRRELTRWRGVVLDRWAAAVGPPAPPAAHPQATAELEAMRRTVSWRVTSPLRAVRARLPRTGP